MKKIMIIAAMSIVSCTNHTDNENLQAVEGLDASVTGQPAATGQPTAIGQPATTGQPAATTQPTATQPIADQPTIPKTNVGTVVWDNNGNPTVTTIPQQTPPFELCCADNTNTYAEPCLSRETAPNDAGADVDHTMGAIMHTGYGDWWYDNNSIRCDSPWEWGKGLPGDPCLLWNNQHNGTIIKCQE